MRTRCLGLLAGIFLWSTLAAAQAVSTQHVIPQVADGGGFITLFFIIRQSTASSISCTVGLFGGLSNARMNTTSAVMGSASSGYVLATRGDEAAPLASGYAVITCSASVSVNAQYLIERNVPISGATIFSQSSFTDGMFHALHGPPDIRLGIAIANHSTQSVTYQLTAFVGSSIIGKTLTVAARSSNVGFLDEILALPSGAGVIAVQVASAAPVNAVAFSFFGPDVFVSVPVTIYN